METLFCTFTAAMSGLVPGLKNTRMLILPVEVAVDFM